MGVAAVVRPRRLAVVDRELDCGEDQREQDRDDRCRDRVDVHLRASPLGEPSWSELSLRLSKHALYSLKPITTAAAATPSTTIATMVHSNAPKRDNIVSSLPSPCLAPCEAPTGHAEADAYSPRPIRAITKPVFSIVKTSNVNGSLSRVPALDRKSKVEMLSLS